MKDEGKRQKAEGRSTFKYLFLVTRQLFAKYLKTLIFEPYSTNIPWRVPVPKPLKKFLFQMKIMFLNITIIVIII